MRDLASATRYGRGVKVAILDSGRPPPLDEGWDFDVPVEMYRDADTFGHATAVASILFGDGINVGLCRMATPYYVKVLDSCGLGSVKSVVRGIYKAIRHKADVINLSLGFARTDRCPEALEEACKIAYDAGIPVICAAGNDSGDVNWPAALDTTICVGSCDKGGVRASFSCRGEVDFVAPGMRLSVSDLDGSSKFVSGTSFSAALITGVVVLLIKKIQQSGQSVRVSCVRKELQKMAIDAGDPGWDKDTGYGIVAGKCIDPTVGMQTSKSIFDIIVAGVKNLLGLHKGAVKL